MSKLKRYYVTETHVQLYEVYDKDKTSALNMVTNKTSGGLAGSPTQKGFNTIIHIPKLVSYEVTDELDQPNSETTKMSSLDNLIEEWQTIVNDPYKSEADEQRAWLLKPLLRLAKAIKEDDECGMKMLVTQLVATLERPKL